MVAPGSLCIYAVNFCHPVYFSSLHTVVAAATGLSLVKYLVPFRDGPSRYLVHVAPCTIRTLWMRVTGGAVWDRFANTELARMKLIVWWECSQIYLANNGHSLSSQKTSLFPSPSLTFQIMLHPFFPTCPHLQAISPFRQLIYLTSLSFSIFPYAISRLLSLLYTHREHVLLVLNNVYNCK